MFPILSGRRAHPNGAHFGVPLWFVDPTWPMASGLDIQYLAHPRTDRCGFLTLRTLGCCGRTLGRSHHTLGSPAMSCLSLSGGGFSCGSSLGDTYPGTLLGTLVGFAAGSNSIYNCFSCGSCLSNILQRCLAILHRIYLGGPMVLLCLYSLGLDLE